MSPFWNGVLAGGGTGMGLLALGIQLSRWLRPVTVRCTWCGQVAVSAKGQACQACIESVAKDGRAAPDGWPEA